MMQKLVDATRLGGQTEITLNDVKQLEEELVTQGAPYLSHFNVLDSDYSVEEVTLPAMRRFGKGVLALVSKIGSTRSEGWVEKEEIVRSLEVWKISRQAATQILAKLQEAKILACSEAYQEGEPRFLRVTVPLLRKRYLAQDMYEQYFQDVRQR